MLVELHLLQSFAPSNLNRDDTGSPKDCQFGGVRRARISSQCLKRAIRRDGEFAAVVGQLGAVRTRRLIVEVAERLSGEHPAPEPVTKVVAEVFKEAGLERAESRGRGAALATTAAAATEAAVPAEKDNTKLLLFMDARSVEEAVAVFRARWEALTRAEKSVRAATIAELGAILVRSARVPEVALFGRMIEIDDKKPFGQLQLRTEAACQVAHALSTHTAGVEFDFFTAVDDLQPRGQNGAGMMGIVEFNSACFYRYANVDLTQLTANLGGDQGLALRALEAFVWAAIRAIPTGKQNSMAAQNPPSAVLAVVRDRGLWSLANAFERPVRASREGSGLVEQSIAALDAGWGKLARMYGTQGIRGVWLAQEEVAAAALPHLGRSQVGSVAHLIGGVLQTVAAAGVGADAAGASAGASAAGVNGGAVAQRGGGAR